MRKMGLWVVAAMLLGMVQGAVAETYKVDPAHSSVMFRIGHLNLSFVYGRFNGATGTVEFDPAAPDKTRFDVSVEAKNVDTAVPPRDTHLRSADFFDVEKYPAIQFKSTSVKSAGDKAMEVTGDLSLHGVTKPITITMKHTGSGKDQKGKDRSGFETEFTINRTDYGMKTFPGVGDEVTLMIALEGAKQ